MNANRLAVTFRFSLLIGSDQAASFSDVSGISSEIEMETIKEGGRNHSLIQLPTAIRFPRLTLKRGMVDFSLLKWYLEFRDNGIVRKENLTVSLKNSMEIAVHEWYFESAFPVKWDGPALNAMSSAVAFESIEFVHSGMTDRKL